MEFFSLEFKFKCTISGSVQKMPTNGRGDCRIDFSCYRYICGTGISQSRPDLRLIIFSYYRYKI